MHTHAIMLTRENTPHMLIYDFHFMALNIIAFCVWHEGE